VSTAVYFLSDVLEASHGGFTTVQLWLTLAAEAVLPAVVVGLYQVQRPQIGCLGQYSAAAYAVAYLYFTCTVIYALAHGTPDRRSQAHDPGPRWRPGPPPGGPPRGGLHCTVHNTLRQPPDMAIELT
jgi:hypothetical protein